MSLPSLSPISTGSDALSNVSTSALSLGNLILVVPSIVSGLSQTKGYQPQNPPTSSGAPSKFPQPKSFIFDYEGEQTAELVSDITDHFVENNTSIQDQIALRPPKITTKGFVSELNDIPPAFLQSLKNIAQKLTTINSYAPAISLTAQLAYNEAFLAYQTVVSLGNAAVSAWSSIAGGPEVIFGNEQISGVNGFPLFHNQTQSRQQLAFSTFYGYWKTRTLFTIQTPWAIFGNMAIERIHPIQSEETQMFTTFECTFKQIRTVQSAVPTPQSAISQGRLSNQSQALASQGTSTPQTDISLMEGLTGPDSASYPSLFA